MTRKTIPVTIDGTTYEIPQLWLVGATRRQSYADAIAHWHEQAQLEAGIRDRADYEAAVERASA